MGYGTVMVRITGGQSVKIQTAGGYTELGAKFVAYNNVSLLYSFSN